MAISMGIFLLVVMFVLLFLGAPMMVGLLLAPVLAILRYMPDIDLMWLAQQATGGIEVFSLLAVPMFIFAADIMSYGQTSKRLLDFVYTFVGHIRGGLAITTAATCTIFGAISGSTQATVVAIGKPMYQDMVNKGYGVSESIALIINAANIALLIPPSTVMVMYGVVTGASVGELFIAGVGPGLIVLGFFALYNYFDAKRKGIPVEKKVSWADRWQSFKKALLPLGFPAIIVGGIYSGLFSPTEAAAISVAYAFILEFFIFKTIKLKDITEIALSTAVVTSVVFILVAAGAATSWVLSLARIPQVLAETVLGVNPSAFKVLAMVSIFFFVACMFTDQLVAIIILAPMFVGPAAAAGIDPIHLGIVVTMQAAIGSCTPPFGCNIFTASAVFNKPYLTVIRKTVPYFIMYFIISLLMFIPEIALISRNLLY
ncbi:MAG: TRAP transporter large permease [Tissierellaceae bacterium]|nr:TRAP transporter large permease [Tissierellaceae bacterium]